MPTIVVPFRGPGGKQRLEPLPARERAAVAEAMLADVLAACAGAGRAVVVAPEAAWDAAVAAGADELVADPGGGQGRAVAAALAGAPDEPVLIVNADVPCVASADLLALVAELPAGGLALVEAADGTTNALALASPQLYRPLYGPGSADRFRALGPARTVPIRNLIDDVDTIDDLRRLGPRLGPHTRRALAAIGQQAGAVA